MSSISRFLHRYDYALPRKLIANFPVAPRDSAKLLVYKRNEDKVFYDTFLQLPEYLPKGALLVFNQTKVLPARLVLTKDTGGRVRALCIGEYGGCVKALSEKTLAVGSKLWIKHPLCFLVQGKEHSFYFLKPSFSLSRLPRVLEEYGITPIPPYIKNTPLSEGELRVKYQSVFAKERGAVAAPTASLHFTSRLLLKLKRRGFDCRFITLHVGLGTFASLTEETLRRKKLHGEQYIIDRSTAYVLNQAKKAGRPIIAVGTTVVRTLESAADRKGHLGRLSGETQLFIREGYRFKFVDGMVTNFHVPKSSLLMLVSAFAGREKVFELYEKAIQKRFRFFSFGDGMLLL